jgi:hypothetical protein
MARPRAVDRERVPTGVRARRLQVIKEGRFEIAFAKTAARKPPLLVMKRAISAIDPFASGTNGAPNRQPCATPAPSARWRRRRPALISDCRPR